MSVIIFVLIIVAGSIIVSNYRGWKKRRNLDRVFSGRPILDDQAFYDRYFAKLGVLPEVAIGLRKILSTRLRTDLLRLSDNDDFTENLQFLIDCGSLADDEFGIFSSVEDRFGIGISEEETQRIRTVRDMILLVDRKVKAKTV